MPTSWPMRCSTNITGIARDLRGWISAGVLAVCLASGPPAAAQDAPPAAPAQPPPEAAPADDDAPAISPADEALTRLRQGALDIGTLSEVLPLLADPKHREIVRSKIIGIASPPQSELVELLDHPFLATRLAALELLEELAGTDHAFNPWLAGESPENDGPRARWRAWAGKKTGTTPATRLFTDEQRRSYLLDLLGSDADKAARARRMLEAEGLPTVGFLESYLASAPTLPPGTRARVREAQYQIVLSRQLGSQASDTARHLAFGSRDQLLAALSVIRGCGTAALPVLRDFITHTDPLVRETAIDSLLVTGGERAVEIVAPLLEKEPDVNVIHGALRRLKEIKCAASEKLVAGFLTHPDEDLLVSAIQTCLSLSGDSSDRFPMPNERAKANPAQDGAIVKCLADPRWRIRAAALEFVAKRRPPSAKAATLALLEDADPFVRSAAVKAAIALGAKEALPALRKMLLADIKTAPVVLEGYAGLSSNPDAEMIAKLDTAPVDIRVSIIGPGLPEDLLIRYTTDPDTDLACAALRYLAQDSDSAKSAKTAGALLAALRGNDPARVAAALERLRLPDPSDSGVRLDPALARAVAAVRQPGETTALDPLYDAFLLPGADRPPPSDAKTATAVLKGSLAEILTELERYATPETPAELRLPAIFNLVRHARPAGFAALARDLPKLDTAARVAACEAMEQPSAKAAADILTALLRDSTPEVRAAAAECSLSNDKARALVQLLLTELRRPGAPLQPAEALNYRFGYAARENAALMIPWAASVLGDPGSSSPLRVLALVAARGAGGSRLVASVREQTRSDNVHVRRAAWHTLLTLKPNEITAGAKAIAADPAAFVREVLPDRVSGARSNWIIRFSDTVAESDSMIDYNRRAPKQSAEIRTALEGMARRDPSPRLRFEAAFALITIGVPPPDFGEFAALSAKQPGDAQVAYRIADWLDDNAARATPALRPLLDLADAKRISPKNLATLARRMASGETKEFATFAALASDAAKPADPSKPLLEPEQPGQKPPERKSLAIVYFMKPGCPECAKARSWLDDLKKDFPLLTIEEHSILNPDSVVLNQALCDRMGVPSNYHNVAPAVFAQGGWLVKEFTPKALAELLVKTSALSEDETWRGVAENRLAEAAAAVERRYEAITLPAVLLAGLIDGLNPCAFATIIFFLSYLRIARRTPREMLMVGIAFVAAVFLAYFAAGLALHQALEWLHSRFGGLRVWLNYAFGALALVAAVLSLRDAFRARAGRLGEMTLQLPGALKDRIKGVVRTGARARRFVIAAFVSGIAISFLELACTGQVYAPIIYQIQRGNLDAVTWLFLYNLAFIIPLAVIFVMAYAGLRAEALISFQQKHTFAVKLALALLFFALAAFIVVGDRIIGG